MNTLTPANPYKNHRFPAEIIGHAVWLYFRFCLSYRDVEELLFARGIIVTYEAIRKWYQKFGQPYANHLRHRRPRPGDRWHLDEVFLRIQGERHYLWRAVDQDGTVLDRRCPSFQTTLFLTGIRQKSGGIADGKPCALFPPTCSIFTREARIGILPVPGSGTGAHQQTHRRLNLVYSEGEKDGSFFSVHSGEGRSWDLALPALRPEIWNCSGASWPDLRSSARTSFSFLFTSQSGTALFSIFDFWKNKGDSSVMPENDTAFFVDSSNPIREGNNPLYFSVPTQVNRRPSGVFLPAFVNGSWERSGFTARLPSFQ
jgi:DDE domain